MTSSSNKACRYRSIELIGSVQLVSVSIPAPNLKRFYIFGFFLKFFSKWNQGTVVQRTFSLVFKYQSALNADDHRDVILRVVNFHLWIIRSSELCFTNLFQKIFSAKTKTGPIVIFVKLPVATISDAHWRCAQLIQNEPLGIFPLIQGVFCWCYRYIVNNSLIWPYLLFHFPLPFGE